MFDDAGGEGEEAAEDVTDGELEDLEHARFGDEPGARSRPVAPPPLPAAQPRSPLIYVAFAAVVIVMAGLGTGLATLIVGESPATASAPPPRATSPRAPSPTAPPIVTPAAAPVPHPPALEEAMLADDDDIVLIGEIVIRP